MVERPTVQFDFTTTDVVSGVNAVCRPSPALVTVSDHKSNRKTVEIQLDRHHFGRFNFPLQLSGITRDGIVLPILEIPVTGRVVRDVQIVPPQAVFGIIPVSETRRETLLLRSQTGQPIRVESVRSVDDQVRVTLLSEPSDADHPGELGFVLHVSPGKRGTYESKVEIRVASGDEWQTQATISFPVSYVATDEIPPDDTAALIRGDSHWVTRIGKERK